jgi:hypothetical protein
VGNLSSYTPEFSDVVRSIVDAVLLDVNFCLPAKIVSYDSKTQYADVEVQLQSKFIDGSLVTHPVIPKVPVKHSRANAGAAFIHMPLQPGDDVTLVFSQRSLDNWKTKGGITDPDDYRKFHFTDAYALIGGSSIPDAFTPNTTDSIEIVNGETSVIVHPDGKFSATNSTAELIDVLDQITEQVSMTNATLSTDTTNTIFGPEPLLNKSTYASIHSQLEELKTMLDSFKV